MSKRVSQLEMFLVGFRDASDNPANGYIVKFFTADQTYTTPKNAWDDVDKSSTLTSVTLDSNGRYTSGLYFAGGEVYDLRLYESDGTTVVRSYPDVKVPETTTSVRVVTASSVTATIDDKVILCDTTSNAITVNLFPVANAIDGIVIKNIGNMSNNVTVDGDGSELINGAATATLIDGAAQEFFSDGSKWYGAATTTGTAYTSTNLAAGSGIAFSTGGGTTNIDTDPASQAEQEAGSEVNKPVVPATQQYHQSAAKAWISFDGTGTISITGSYNVASITDRGTGEYTVTFDTDFSDLTYACIGTTNAQNRLVAAGATAVGSSGCATTITTTGALADVSGIQLAYFGDQ